MVENADAWLTFVGVTDPLRLLIEDGFTSDGLVVGDSVEKLSQRVGATIIVVESAESERRFAAIQSLSQQPDTYVVVLVDTVDADVYVRSMKCGAVGVAHVDSGVEHIAAVTAAALRHDCLMPRSVVSSILDRPDLDRLAHTEMQILDCLRQGMNTKQIATALNVSGRTARRRIHNLYLALGVDDAAAALERAHQLQLPTRNGDDERGSVS